MSLVFKRTKYEQPTEQENEIWNNSSLRKNANQNKTNTATTKNMIVWGSLTNEQNHEMCVQIDNLYSMFDFLFFQNREMYAEEIYGERKRRNKTNKYRKLQKNRNTDTNIY